MRTFGTVGPWSLKVCPCCKQRATHIGYWDGVAKVRGCHWLVRKWVKDPASIAALSLGYHLREPREQDEDGWPFSTQLEPTSPWGESGS